MSRGEVVDTYDAAPPAKKLAMLRAELEARMAALEGGDAWAGGSKHGANVKWLAGEIWELERRVGALERPSFPGKGHP